MKLSRRQFLVGSLVTGITAAIGLRPISRPAIHYQFGNTHIDTNGVDEWRAFLIKCKAAKQSSYRGGYVVPTDFMNDLLNAARGAVGAESKS